MNDFVDSFAYWLADYYLATTVLLAAAHVALAVMKQPAKRLAIVKAALLANVLLILLSALPAWSLIHVAMSWPESQRAPVEAPTTNVAPLPIVPMDVPTFTAPVPSEVVPLAAADVAPRKSLTWLEIALAAYALGSVATLLWLALGMAFARRLLAAATPAHAEIEDILSAVVSAAPLRPRLRVSEQIDVAAALGIWRPTVLLPKAWAEDRPAAELRTILAHECAHIQNGDIRWLTLGRVLSIVLWLQPLHWLVRRRMRLDQESLADAAAAALSTRVTYAEQLVAWARAVPRRPRPALASSVGLWESPSQLRRRVALLLDEHFPVLRECSRRMRWLSLIICGLVAIALSMVTLQPTHSQVHYDEPNETVDRTDQSLSPQTEINSLNDANPTTEQSGGIIYDPLGLPVAEGELLGKVIDEAGRPLADVNVDVWTWYPGNETKTDGEGRFQLKGFEPHQQIEVQFSKSGFCPKYRAALEVGRVNWIVTLDSRTYLEGRVTGKDGEPVAKAQVRASRGPFENPEVVIGEVSTAANTDAEGNYRLYLEPATYDVQMRVPTMGMARHPTVVLRDGDRTRLDIELREGPKFRAVVRDSVTNMSVAGIRLWNWQRPGIEGVSNKDGMIEIGNMPSGHFEFQVAAAGQPPFKDVAGDYARWWSPAALKQWQRLDLTDHGEGFQRNFDDLEFDVREGMGPVTIIMERAVRIRGQVLDPDRKPVAGATVAPAKTGSGNSLTGDTRYSVSTGADGKFEMLLPASGAAKYNLIAHDGKYEEWRTWANGVGELLQTKPGDQLENVTLQLSKPCVVRGRVVDANGEPVPKHSVRAQAADKTESRYYDPTTKTDENGEFELRFVRPGKHYVQADPFWLVAEQGPRAAWQLVETNSERPVEDVVLRLAAENRANGSFDTTFLELQEKADEIGMAAASSKDDGASGDNETQHAVTGGGTIATFVAGNPATPWDYKPNLLALAVQDEAGKPLEGVEAVVYRVSPQSGERGLVKRATTDAKGAVDFVGLVDAERAAEFQAQTAKSQFPLVQGDIFYTVLRRPGLATVILAASDFTLAGRGVKRSVRMRPAAELTGRVTDTQGKPVAGATVAAGGIAGFFALDGVNAVKTDTDGRYRFVDRVAFDRVAANKRIAEQNQWALAANRDMSKMYPAVYDPAEDTSVSNLFVTHPDYAVTTVGGGNVPGETDVVMQPAAVIEGRVVDFGTGKPVAGTRVQTVGQPTPTDRESSPTADESGRELFAGTWHNASTQTDAAGEYRLGNLPAGNYEVWAEAANEDGSSVTSVSRGIVGIGARGGGPAAQAPDLVLGPGGVIRGRLVDATTGKPLEVGDVELTVKAVIQLVDPMGLQSSPQQTASVGRDGRFEVRTVPGRSRVFLIVNANQADSNPQGDFRSGDDAFETGPVFDLKHGESVDAEFSVWPRAKLEEARAALIRGFEMLNQRKYDETIAAFDAVIGKNPRDESAIRARAEAYERAGRLAEATAEFERILATSSDGYGKIIMMNNLASLLATNPIAGERDGQRAVELSTQAIAMAREVGDGFPQMAELLDTLASGQAESGDFEAAVATQREAIEAAKDSVRDSLRDRLKLYEAGKPYRREMPAKGK